MVGVQNHFDYLTAVLKNNRLFVVPEDDRTSEVHAPADLCTVSKESASDNSVVYRPDIDGIFVTDGSDGDLKIFNGTTYETAEDLETPGRFGCDCV
jgi:WD40 repeat protein